eukprot:SAG11_NODE_988_length_6275_cov_10.173413_2_plen_82_part_00
MGVARWAPLYGSSYRVGLRVVKVIPKRREGHDVVKKNCSRSKIETAESEDTKNKGNSKNGCEHYHYVSQPIGTQTAGREPE